MADPFSGEAQFRAREGAQRYNPIQAAPPEPPAVPTSPPPAQTTTTQTPPPAPAQGWGIQWPSGNVVMPQPVRDFGTVAGQEAGMGLPGLRAQAADVAAAKQRLGPTMATTADVVGGALSPSNLAMPWVGPTGAGALHEGIKSYMSQPNWWPDAQGWKEIGGNTATGAATGTVARLAGGAVNPENIGSAAGAAVKGIPGLLGLHYGGDFGAAWMADKFGKGVVEPAAQKVENAISSIPYPDWARTAVQSAALGGAQTAADSPEGNTALQNLRSGGAGVDWNTAKTALQNLRGMLPY